VKLFIYRHPSGIRNFGDELGAAIFPRLLPGCLNDDDSTLLLGIGSILFDNHPPDARKIVLGAGFGGYTKPPRIDSRWEFLGVRGPLTCRALGLPAHLAIGDPAVLLRTQQGSLPAARRFPVSFMPHWQSLGRGAWRRAAALAGIHLIDPTAPVPNVLAEIEASALVLAEAMHGAIVADALRVPWVALRPLDPIHRFKWHDWARSLDLALRWQPLAASSLTERLDTLRLAGRAPARRLTRALPALADVGAERFAHAAAESLRRAAWGAPCLSTDTALDRSLTRVQEAVEKFRRDYAIAAR
jgi:succinoglycan biosynthesis protein ExoV